MAELDITQEQFMSACSKASQNILHKQVVDQIMSVDDFVAFKKLMCKRNGELNKQAMLMLKKQAEDAEKVKEEEVKKNKAKEEEAATKSKNVETIVKE